MSMKLNSYYKKSMRKIDKNYERIVKTYGGALQYLVEKDQESSSIEFSVEECKSKIEDIQNDLSDLKYAIEYIDEQIRSNYIDLLFSAIIIFNVLLRTSDNACNVLWQI